MIEDLYQRAYTKLFPSADCYCGVKVVEERVRETVKGDWELRIGNRFIIRRYDARTGEPHNIPYHCSTENLTRALKRNQNAARRVWYRMSEQPKRKKR